MLSVRFFSILYYQIGE